MRKVPKLPTNYWRGGVAKAMVRIVFVLEKSGRTENKIKINGLYFGMLSGKVAVSLPMLVSLSFPAKDAYDLKKLEFAVAKLGN